jgi:hypothetical protein
MWDAGRYALVSVLRRLGEIDLMSTTQLAFRCVRQGDHFIIGVYVGAENKWYEADMTAGQVETLGEVIKDALATPVPSKE